MVCRYLVHMINIYVHMINMIREQRKICFSYVICMLILCLRYVWDMSSYVVNVWVPKMSKEKNENVYGESFFLSHIFTTYDDISQTYPKHMINIHITYEKHIFLCSLIMFIICTHMFIICTRYLQTIICRRPYYIWVHMTYIWSTHEGHVYIICSAYA